MNKRKSRMKRSIRLISSLLLLLPLVIQSAAADRLVLQLKWEHEFQFAGYYAALWQGYYASEGLDVEIRPATTPDGKLLSPLQELREGRADFAIGAMDILVEKDRGEPLIILAPIFQRSPTSVFALPGTPLNNVMDLAKLRIASPPHDFTRAEIQALFKSMGIDTSQTTFVDAPPTLETLHNGIADAISTYSISARIAAAEQGVQLQELDPNDYGLDFYGDTLYTHAKVQQEKPEQVEKFVRASLKGWQYALQHRAEIARRISRELPRNLFSYQDQEHYNQAFAGIINSYMAYPYLPVGQNNPVRWQQMYDQLKAAGVIEGRWELESLFARPAASHISGILSLGGVLALITLILLSYYLLNQRQQAWGAYSFIIIGVLLTEVTLERQLRQNEFQNRQLAVTQQLSSIGSRLSGVINNNLALISGLAAHIAINPQIRQEEFERYAKAVFRQEPLLMHMAAAPDMVVSLIYPLAGNKTVLGLDYNQNEAQRDAALRVRQSGKMIVAGPVNLVQGGVAFVGRTGVFTGEEEFWGIVSAPIAASELYQSAGLLDPGLEIEIAIRGKDGLGTQGAVFFGDKRLFEDPRAAFANISVGNGSWQLAARPEAGWEQTSLDVWALRMASLILAALLMIFADSRFRRLSSERRYQSALRENENLLQEVGKLANIGGWRIASDSKVIRWNRQCSRLLDWPSDYKPQSLSDILGVFELDQANELQHSMDKAFKGLAFDIELAFTTVDDNKRWLRIIGNPVSPGDAGYEVVSAAQDITERKQFTELIQQQATYDLLTGLPNRFLFNNRLQKAVAKARRDGSKLAVLFIDLDNFKPVNDNLGHSAGDKLLQEVGKRIRNTVRESDTVSRYSGDEFTVILYDIADELVPLTCGEKILQAINQPFDLQTNQVFCSASIGVSVYPNDGDKAEDLVSKADQAMYEVKKSGRNDCHYFTQAMQALSEKRHKLHTRLVAAIAEEKLEVFYQPIIDLNSNSISKCEALVRWFDDDGKMIPTGDFITVAEESGMVNEIDRFVLKTATQYLTRLSRERGIEMGLSINVSPRLFSAKDKSMQQWLDVVTDAAASLAITVEITERLLTEDSDRALQVLSELKEKGISIAVDDFGTGYSSLSYLTKFPIDIIKIDRSFVSALGASSSGARASGTSALEASAGDERQERRSTIETLTDAIINLAQQLSLKVVAEGVETAEQLDYLRQRNCDYAQGYYLGRPQSQKNFSALVQNNDYLQAKRLG